MAAKRPTPEEIAERVVWGVENDFVSETTEFLVDRLTSVDWHDARAEYWVMRMANENSALLMDIYLKYRDDITDEAREIIEPYVRDIDTERALTDATGLAANSVPYTAAATRIIDATVKGCTEIIQRQNVALVDSLANTWYEVATTAVTRQSRVMASEREIISDAVDELMKAHLYTIDYKSGVHTSIDAAIRRHLVSQVNQNYQRMTDLRAREYGWDLFMCSSHVDSRPEHYELQGKVYSKGQHIGERVDGHVVHDYDEMEIGSVTGIYGANCRHYTTVYIPGLSEVQEPPYSAAENEKRYNLTQKQRAMERRIRNTKAEIAGLEDAGLDATDARLRLGTQQAKIRNFCAENSLTRRADLERAYGIEKQPRALRGTNGAARRQTTGYAGIGGTATGGTPTANAGRNLNIPGFEMPEGKTPSMSKYLSGDYGEPTPMSFKDANRGHVNPNVGTLPSYGENCPACAVAFEMRMRGYNVEAKRYTNSDTARILRHDPAAIWSRVDGSPLHENEMIGYTQEQAIAVVAGTVKNGGRYSAKVRIPDNKGDATYHVVSITPYGDGFRIYDSQNARVMYGSEAERWIGQTSYISIFRTDDAILNIDMASRVLTFGEI